MEPYHRLGLMVAAVVAAVGAICDWRRGTIPNALTLPALAFAPFLHFGRLMVAHEGVEAAGFEALTSVGGAALAAIVPFLLYRMGALGGGDLKLFVALGALLQPVAAIESQMYAFCAGALLAPAKLAYDGKLALVARNALTLGFNLFVPRGRQRPIDAAALTWFRLGPAIFLGVVLTLYLHW